MVQAELKQRKEAGSGGKQVTKSSESEAERTRKDSSVELAITAPVSGSSLLPICSHRLVLRPKGSSQPILGEEAVDVSRCGVD